MEIRIEFDSTLIDWTEIVDILKEAGMSYQRSEIHKQAFENSHTTVFAFDKNKLIGFGRIISDGVYQSAIYDLAVSPAYQGRGVGTLILKKITEATPQCNFILYASPGKEGFYLKANFRKMKTGMALFTKEDSMHQKGFIE